jgi:hypothetical protein
MKDSLPPAAVEPVPAMPEDDQESRAHERAVLLLKVNKIIYLRRLKRPIYLWWC